MATTAPEHSLALVSETTSLTDYEALNNEIQIAQREALGAVFDYNNPKGNKAARSYIFNLRKLRSKIDRKRKDAKASVIELGKRIDASAKQLEAQVTKLITPHENALNEIERLESERVSKIEGYIADILSVREYRGEIHSSLEIHEHLLALEAIDPSPEIFQEFTPKADAELTISLKHLQEQFAIADKREQEAAELKRLREATALREQQDREAAIAEAAAETARKAELDRQEALRAEEAALQAKEFEERQAKLQAEAEAELTRQAEEAALREAAIRAEAAEALRKREEEWEKEKEERRALLAKQEEEETTVSVSDRLGIICRVTTVAAPSRKEVRKASYMRLVSRIEDMISDIYDDDTQKLSEVLAEAIFEGTLFPGLELNWDVITASLVANPPS